MKKVIVLVLMVCIMLYGCSSNDDLPTDNSNNKMDTHEESPTNIQNEYYIDGACDICHFTKKLKEYRYETLPYAVCEDCFNNEILGYEKDKTIYDELLMGAQLATTNENILIAIKDKEIRILFDPSGIQCDEHVISDYLSKELEIDFNQKAETGFFAITMKDYMVTKENAPKHPLEKSK